MNAILGHADGLSWHSSHFIFFQIKLNDVAFVKIGNWPLLFLSCMFSLTAEDGKDTQALLSIASQPDLVCSEFPEPATFSCLCEGFSSCPRSNFTPISYGCRPGGWSHLLKKMQEHLETCQWINPSQTTKNLPWENQVQSSLFFKVQPVVFSGFQMHSLHMCTPATAICWRFKPSALPLCSWVYNLTPFMSFCICHICHDPIFFFLPATMGPPYTRW